MTNSQWNQASALVQLSRGISGIGKPRVENGVENSTIQSPQDTIALWLLLEWNWMVKLAFFYYVVSSRACRPIMSLPSPSWLQEVSNILQGDWSVIKSILSSWLLRNQNRTKHFLKYFSMNFGKIIHTYITIKIYNFPLPPKFPCAPSKSSPLTLNPEKYWSVYCHYGLFSHFL